MLPDKLESEDVRSYGLRLTDFIQPLVYTRSQTSPSRGGCWYCWTKDPEPDRFSFEFDTFLHLECLKRWLVGHPKDDEAHIFAAELGVKV